VTAKLLPFLPRKATRARRELRTQRLPVTTGVAIRITTDPPTSVLQDRDPLADLLQPSAPKETP
jgi:hypothetical protein